MDTIETIQKLAEQIDIKINIEETSIRFIKPRFIKPRLLYGVLTIDCPNCDYGDEEFDEWALAAECCLRTLIEQFWNTECVRFVFKSTQPQKSILAKITDVQINVQQECTMLARDCYIKVINDFPWLRKNDMIQHLPVAVRASCELGLSAPIFSGNIDSILPNLSLLLPTHEICQISSLFEELNEEPAENVFAIYKFIYAMKNRSLLTKPVPVINKAYHLLFFDIPHPPNGDELIHINELLGFEDVEDVSMLYCSETLDVEFDR